MRIMKINKEESFTDRHDKILTDLDSLAWECKRYILNNYKWVKNWSTLTIYMQTYKNDVRMHYSPKGVVIGKFIDMPPNPVESLTDVVLDDIDGDFSLTINNKKWLWLTNGCVVTLADYIREQLAMVQR
jgi:hypothetical protein